MLKFLQRYYVFITVILDVKSSEQGKLDNSTLKDERILISEMFQQSVWGKNFP